MVVFIKKRCCVVPQSVPEVPIIFRVLSREWIGQLALRVVGLCYLAYIYLVVSDEKMKHGTREEL